ncbi:MAG: winged helix-turn-helix domain-containing protein [Pyrinomonadaceae bacterium]
MDKNRQQLFEFGPFLLDPAERLLLRNGERVPLTPKVFETLIALVECRGRLIEKDKLMKLVWPDSFVEEANLTNNISTLRKALGENERNATYIETIPKVGYRFTAHVREAPGLATELVVERHRLTRIETEEREEAIHTESATKPVVSVPVDPVLPTARAVSRRSWNAAALIAVFIITGGLAAFGIYWAMARLQARHTMPFSAMEISRFTTSGTIMHASVSRDGRYVASVVKDGDANSVWVRNVGAPSNVRIAGPSEAELISVSFAPDGNSVYYIELDRDKGESILYRVPTLGGASKPIATDIYPIGFSPDGRQIAFIRFRQSESHVVVADIDGSNQRDVATRHKPDSFVLEWNAPAWSPDQKKIAVAARLNDQRGHFAAIVGVNLADGTQSPLSSTRWSYVGQPVFLADGSGLLLPASEGAGFPTQVWHVSLPDGVATRITHDLNNYQDLSITSDSKRLAAVQVQAVSSIWVAPGGNAAGAKQIKTEVGSLEVLAWAPDRQIVYRSSAGGSGADIWLMNEDGSNARQLTVGARVSRGLAVTQDGRHIVFSSDRAGQFNLWRVDTDGSNLRQLTAGDGEFYPQCTPDGRWVIYQSNEFIDPRVWKVAIEGGESVQLTTARATKPAVSPDGQMIAYSYLDIELNPSRWGIGIISSAGGQRLNRFDFPPTVVYRTVRWSPDGQSIAFVNNAGGVSDIWLQPLNGSPPKQLTNFKAEQILAFDWSGDGRSLALVRGTETGDVVLIEQRQR